MLLVAINKLLSDIWIHSFIVWLPGTDQAFKHSPHTDPGWFLAIFLSSVTTWIFSQTSENQRSGRRSKNKKIQNQVFPICDIVWNDYLGICSYYLRQAVMFWVAFACNPFVTVMGEWVNLPTAVRVSLLTHSYICFPSFNQRLLRWRISSVSMPWADACKMAQLGSSQESLWGSSANHWQQC